MTTDTSRGDRHLNFRHPSDQYIPHSHHTQEAEGRRRTRDERSTSAPHHEKRKQKKPSFVRRTVNAWWDRLMGAVSSGSLANEEEEYATHRTTLDYVWNSAGLATWGLVFPLLTIVVTQIVGVEQAGEFSLAFVIGNLLMIIANYGARTYQVSDIDEEQSFSDYQVNRWATCLIMMVIGLLICRIRGYEGMMLTMSVCIYAYRMVDGLADVYEGRLQQMDKLYLAGISQALRSVATFVAFTIFLFITRNLAVASIAMIVTASGFFLLLTLPLAFFETPRSRRFEFAGIGKLFKQCFPVFIALFLYALIDNMPKFIIDGLLGYDDQLYFNVLYFPAQSILLCIGFLYKPLLVRMANAWADTTRRKRFDLFIVAVVAVIIVITLLFIGLYAWIGIPITSFMYGVDFEQFRQPCYLMLIAGGFTAGIDFLYQVITVMRRQELATKLYLIAFAFSLFVPVLLVHFYALTGAVLGYLVVMGILFVLLLVEYIGLRIAYRRHPENDPTGAITPVEPR